MSNITIEFTVSIVSTLLKKRYYKKTYKLKIDVTYNSVLYLISRVPSFRFNSKKMKI